MAKLPAFDDLLKAYPNIGLEQVKALIGASVDADWVKNACTLRVSRSLNYAGAKLPFIKDDEGQQVLKGADGRWYLFRVRKLQAYLTSHYGRPDITAVGKAGEGVKVDSFLHARGIIGMRVPIWNDATGHFTLWDGKAFADGHDAYLKDATEVWLWKAG